MKTTVLITGASSGIGQVTARLFTEEGSRVFGTSRQKRSDENGVEMLELDVRSDDSVECCVAEVLARAGQIDVLINNAGIAPVRIAEETPLKEAWAVFETNFFGVTRMTRAVLPHMRARKQGRIINVGSLAAWIGEPGEAFYSASKAALARYTEALRYEVWPLGIHVSLVEPGAVKTKVLETAAITEGTIADYEAVRQAARRTLRQALRQGDDPDKVARLILKVARARSPQRPRR